MASRVTIVDYGTGNLFSVEKSFRRLGVEVEISSDRAAIAAADRIVLPGVGHFGRTMRTLHELKLVDALNDAVLRRRTRVLGICLGMELMGRHGEEGDTVGLGWIDADAVRFDVCDRQRYKVPHIGWNTVNKGASAILFAGVDDSEEYYFLHSYHLNVQETASVAARTRYENEFVSAVEKGNIFGVQFHPEKSHDAGERILQNFLKS